MSDEHFDEPHPETDVHIIKPEPKENILSRRAFIGNSVRLAALGALVAGGASMGLPFVSPDAFGASGPQPVVRRGDLNEKIPITLADLAGEPPVVLTAEWAFLPAVIYKVKKSILEGSSSARGRNTAQHAVQHPTEPENAILVYEGKCKHLGCTVGWDGALGGSKDIEDYNGDGAKDGRILCPCHQGQYDIYNFATNVPGTPPPTPLNVVRAKVGVAELPTGNTPNSIIGFEKLVQNGPNEADLQGEGAPFAMYVEEAA